MKPEELYWSLLNRTDLRQVTGLTFDQARFMMTLLDPSQLGNWLAWHEGLEKWTPLKEFKELVAELAVPALSSPPMPPPDAGKDMGIDDNIKKDSMRVDKRLNRRFLKEYRVEIMDPQGVRFETRTVNVSTHGMLLAENVPEDFGRSFKCTVSRSDGSSLTVFCTLIKEREGNARNRVKIVDVSQVKVLMSWLIDSKTS